MSNYPEGNAPYEGAQGAGASTTGPPNTGASAYPESAPGGYQGVDMGHGGGAPHYQTQQFPPAGQPHWQGQPSYTSNQSSSDKKDEFSRRLKTIPSEFLVFAVTALALLIAAAVTDRGDDNQGFGAQDAWKYVTALAIAYILARGLAKFGGGRWSGDRDGDDRR